MHLKDRVAIITGGGRGIGRDIAFTYGRGARVVLNHVDPTTCEETAAEAANRLHMNRVAACPFPAGASPADG
jgi:NAD(P)-dependent dehydrogenase (short-subunit alcohol dehydrogenase family)